MVRTGDRIESENWREKGVAEIYHGACGEVGEEGEKQAYLRFRAMWSARIGPV